MNTAKPLAVRELPALFDRVCRALAARRAAIDDLNVFPVPDGDTGTNMTLTVQAGRDALTAARSARPRPDRHELAGLVIRGTLRGARGNSGVILSQVIRAVVEVTVDVDEVDASLYAAALRHARDLAREAVAAPVEGTILTAIAAAAEAATAAADEDGDLVATSAAACSATARAVERTPSQLPVLAEAGVVDAGARGFEVVLAAVHGHLSGVAPEVVHDPPRAQGPRGQDTASCDAPRHHAYEVQYLLDAPEGSATPLRRALEELGDSVVVVTAGDLLNVHVHTDRIGPAIEAGLSHGQASQIQVDDLRHRVAERDAVRYGADGAGVAVVLRGEGLAAIAHELGAVTVDGAAGELPSVDDLLAAVRATGRRQVVLLPGHPNVRAAAHRAVDEAVRDDQLEVVVIEQATTPPALLAALAVFDPWAPFETVVEELASAAVAVRSLEIVDAVRDATTPLGPVVAGQPLALSDGELIAVGDDPASAVHQALVSVGLDDVEVVTVLHGGGDHGERERVTAVVTELAVAVGAELEVVDAGVSPARCWIGLT